MKPHLPHTLFAFLAALAWAVPALAPVDPPAGQIKPPVPPPLPPHKDKPPDPKPTVPGTQPAPKEPAKGVNVLLPVDPEAARPGLHEFTTLEGELETFPALIFRIKALRLRLTPRAFDPKDARMFAPHFKGPVPIEVSWPPGTTTEKRDDGTVVGRLPDGTIVEIRPDGGWVIKQPDGTTTQVLPDGTEAVHYPDGSTVVRFPNGTTAWVWPNGGWIIRYPSGARVERQPDGTVIEHWPGQPPKVHPPAPKPGDDFGAHGPTPPGPQQATAAAKQGEPARTAQTTWIAFAGGAAGKLSAEVRQSPPAGVPSLPQAAESRFPSTVMLGAAGPVVVARRDGGASVYRADGCMFDIAPDGGVAGGPEGVKEPEPKAPPTKAKHHEPVVETPAGGGPPGVRVRLLCGFYSKKLLRSVWSGWRVKSKDEVPVPGGDPTQVVVWEAVLWNEFEVIGQCPLPNDGHGDHQPRRVVYEHGRTLTQQESYPARTRELRPPPDIGLPLRNPR
ncbi:MAG: hypothetical protein FJ291_05305 [Planctomycetes bacterium]|nr:hypothetical protein [Planctomycetota bacterium]